MLFSRIILVWKAKALPCTAAHTYTAAFCRPYYLPSPKPFASQTRETPQVRSKRNFAHLAVLRRAQQRALMVPTESTNPVVEAVHKFCGTADNVDFLISSEEVARNRGTRRSEA